MKLKRFWFPVSDENVKTKLQTIRLQAHPYQWACPHVHSYRIPAPHAHRPKMCWRTWLLSEYCRPADEWICGYAWQLVPFMTGIWISMNMASKYPGPFLQRPLPPLLRLARIQQLLRIPPAVEKQSHSLIHYPPPEENACL